jgi:beta-1,4-mannosyl-glycoprotein beta-1,4-N-acetylglucosaminyltransferase
VIFDCFPFFNELDVLEVRLHELAPVVDKFLILECGETFGGDKKPFHFDRTDKRFAEFAEMTIQVRIGSLHPECKDRVTGRMREAYQRDSLLPCIRHYSKSAEDVIMVSDCDEIPSAAAVREALPKLKDGIHRFKQRSFYYNVNTLVDYGHDFASRARIGTRAQLEAVGSVYKFRMAPALEIENGGWHFGYFGGKDRIKQKVAALAPFLTEYKLFGDDTLEKDIRERRDLHHRRCEMPETFWPASSTDPTLPQYLLDNPERFSHFHG